MSITVCPKCRKAYETTEENANEPLWQSRTARWCGPCARADREQAAVAAYVAEGLGENQ